MNCDVVKQLLSSKSFRFADHKLLIIKKPGGCCIPWYSMCKGSFQTVVRESLSSGHLWCQQLNARCNLCKYMFYVTAAQVSWFTHRNTQYSLNCSEFDGRHTFLVIPWSKSVGFKGNAVVNISTSWVYCSSFWVAKDTNPLSTNPPTTATSIMLWRGSKERQVCSWPPPCKQKT